MKVLQNKFLGNLPKVVLVVITFYNFAWIYWQNLTWVGVCVACPWYRLEGFPVEPFLFVLASYLLFIENGFVYSVSCVIGGYLSINWLIFLGSFFFKMDQTFFEYVNRMKMEENNPLTILESQAVIALLVFSLATYSLIRETVVKKDKVYL
jgi:hypothetical protein